MCMIWLFSIQMSGIKKDPAQRYVDYRTMARTEPERRILFCLVHMNMSKKVVSTFEGKLTV